MRNHPLLPKEADPADPNKERPALQREAAEMGLRVNGHVPDRQRLQYLLRNPAYVGRIRYFQRANGKISGKGVRPAEDWVDVPGKHPAIVDEETWRAVQRRLIENKAHMKAGEKAEHLLTSYLFCGHCRGRMHGQKLHRYSKKTHERTGEVTHYYQCWNGRARKACEFKTVSGPRVDAAVRRELRRLPHGSEIGITILALRLTEQALDANGPARAQQVRRLKSQRAKHERALLGMTRDYYAKSGAAAVVPSATFVGLIRETEQAIKVIDEELEAGEDINLAKLLAANALLNWPVRDWPPDADLRAWRSWVEFAIERVNVYSIDNIEVVFKPFAQAIIDAAERETEITPEQAEALLARWDKVTARLRAALNQQEQLAGTLKAT